MSILESKITKEYDKRKIREFLKEELGLSSRLIRSAAIDKRIKVDGVAVKMNYVVKTGEEIKIELSKKESQNIEPEKMDIEIVYEDSDILVLNKKPFMVVHPTKSHFENTMANGVTDYIIKKGEDVKIRFVNRLDMNTSGLVIVAKNPFAQHVLSSEMKDDDFEKKYITVVKGIIEEDEGTINQPIYRPTDDSVKRVVDERGQESITHYKVIERLNDATTVEVKLETGRTHQIRVHMAHIGHPIIGDELYGFVDENLIKRQALHAYSLKFRQPRTKELLEFKADIPEDMKMLIQKLK